MLISSRKQCEITTDIVNNDIPLLLSKEAMKKANMKLDLVNDKAEIFGEEVTLQNTSSGHYCVPLKDIQVPIEQSYFSDKRLNDKKQILK